MHSYYLFNRVLVRDFKDYFNKKRVIWKVIRIPKVEYIKLFLFKAIFLYYLIIIPVLTGASWLEAITAFLLMAFPATVFSLTIWKSPHTYIDHDFPLPDGTNPLPVSWLMHQIDHSMMWFTITGLSASSWKVLITMRRIIYSLL